MCRINSRELNQNFRLISFFFVHVRFKNQTNKRFFFLIFDPEKYYFNLSQIFKRKKKCNQRILR